MGMFIFHSKAAKGCYWSTGWEEPTGMGGHGAAQDGADGDTAQGATGGTSYKWHCGSPSPALTVAAVHKWLISNMFSH